MLNLGNDANNSFDCTTTEGTPNDLTWTKNDGSLRFPTTTENYTFMGMQFSSLRMDFAPEDAPFAGYNDVGGYTCTNTVSGEFLSINITAGIYTRANSMYHIAYILYKSYIWREFSLAFAQLYPISGHYYWRSIGTEFLSLHLLFLPLEILPKGCHHR